MSNDIVTINAEKISAMTGYSSEEVAVVKNSVAKGVSDTELAYFLNVCKTVNLNPFVKEIWCYKDHKKNLLVFAGRDGHRTYAQRNPNFNGMRSSEVREKDDFKIDIANNKIEHSFGNGDRGKIVGAYAIVFRKDGEPSIAYAEMDTYDRNFGAWKTHPSAMIKKVAETNALKASFGMSGIQSEYEYDVKGEVVVPIQELKPKEDNITTLKKQVMSRLKDLPEEDRNSYIEMLQEKGKSGELTEELLQNLISELDGEEDKA